MGLGPETKEQIALFQWLRFHPKLKHIAFHVPNERKTSKISGFILKKMGVLAGVSDVFIPVARKGFHGLFIELKAGNRKMTIPQQDFLNNMIGEGYLAVCCHGWEAAKVIIENYMDEEKSNA